MAGQEENESAEGPYYTREGDLGRTNFGPEADVSKGDARVVASAECDEANAAVSVAMALGGLPIEITSMLASVQNDLFDVVADLFAPLNGPKEPRARIHESHIERLERAVDYFAEQAADLSGYVLPGGTVAAALLYQARGVARRAERAIWSAYEEFPDEVNPLTGRYLNRLSSLLFVLGRGANAEHGDTRWVPGASALAMEQEAAAAPGAGPTPGNPL